MSIRAVAPMKPVAATTRVLTPGPLLQRKCDCGGSREQKLERAPSYLLQRKCACSGSANSEDDRLESNQKELQRKPAGAAAPAVAPPIVHDVLSSPGHVLDAQARSIFEPRFGHDFSKVRIHSDSRANESARAVNALAYTVGRDIVFAQQAYAPATEMGKKLLAHELVHVVQQGGRQVSPKQTIEVDSASSEREHEAEIFSMGGPGTQDYAATPRAGRQMLNRADPAAVGRVMGRGAVVGSGIQFWPTNVVDTRVGPVSGVGGLTGDQANRLSVIIGENLTLRGLARQLMPLWSTATPFTPPGAAAAVPNVVITEEDLARGLLVFNQHYLPVPSFTQWRAGLRFPLPVEIDAATGIATVHPGMIHNLAATFDATWQPLLDRPAAATAALAPAALNQQVTEFLAHEPSALARGIALAARAITNAVADRPFITEVLNRLGAAAFDVALAFMDNLVNQQIGLLASQQDGALILAAIEAALNGRPAVVSAAQQASLARAGAMLGQRAGIAARPAPGRACEPGSARQVTVQPVFFRDNAADPAPTGVSFQSRMQVTRDIWAKLGVQFTTNAPIMRNDATHKHSGANNNQIRAVAALRTGPGVEVFVVDNDLPNNGGGGTLMRPPGPASQIVLSDRGTSNTLLAHEMGHVLGLNHPGFGSAHDGEANTIMQPSGSNSAVNPTRNTTLNSRRMTWPAGAATCIMPDP